MKYLKLFNESKFRIDDTEDIRLSLIDLIHDGFVVSVNPINGPRTT